MNAASDWHLVLRQRQALSMWPLTRTIDAYEPASAGAADEGNDCATRALFAQIALRRLDDLERLLPLVLAEARGALKEIAASADPVQRAAHVEVDPLVVAQHRDVEGQDTQALHLEDEKVDAVGGYVYRAEVRPDHVEAAVRRHQQRVPVARLGELEEEGQSAVAADQPGEHRGDELSWSVRDGDASPGDGDVAHDSPSVETPASAGIAPAEVEDTVGVPSDAAAAPSGAAASGRGVGYSLADLLRASRGHAGDESSEPGAGSSLRAGDGG